MTEKQEQPRPGPSRRDVVLYDAVCDELSRRNVIHRGFKLRIHHKTHAVAVWFGAQGESYALRKEVDSVLGSPDIKNLIASLISG